MARRTYGIDESFGRAQVLPSQPYRSPGWGYYIKNRDALKKRIQEDAQEFDEFDELKAWEDERNFNEITEQMRGLQDVWNQAFQGGYNIANPTTPDEMQLQKAFNQKRDRIKQASDLYKLQGEAVADVWKKMRNDDNVDVEKTRQNLMDYVDFEGDVFERAKKIPNIVEYKPEPVDVMKIVTDGLSKYANVEKSILSDAYDPVSGKMKKVTFEGIPEPKRRYALEQIWKYEDDTFKNKIRDVMAGDVANTRNPNDDQQLHDYFIDEFLNVKSGGKVESTYYSLGDGGGPGGRSPGVPQKTGDGAYESTPDTIPLYDPNKNDMNEFTSPYVINLQGVIGETPSNAIAIEMSKDWKNTQTGEPEEVGGIYSVLPSKIVWFPVAAEDQDIRFPQGVENMFKDPLRFILRPSDVKAGTVISDEIMEDIRAQNDRMAGSGKMIRYKWVPYVTARTKYGQVEADDKILSFNRSDYVPLEVIKGDLRAKLEGKGIDWVAYEKAINDINSQLNMGIVKPPDKEIDY